MATITTQKTPIETIYLDLDFRPELLTGETVTSATANVVGSGTITVGATPTVVSPIVTCVVTAGTAGQTDVCRVLATTSRGQVLEAVIYVVVGVEVAVPILYATAEDLVSKLDSSIATELSSAAGDIEAALDDASREIDSRICSRYATPIPATATHSRAILRGKCIGIAIFFLLSRKLSVGHALIESARTDYIAAMDWAAGVAKKVYALPDAPEYQIETPDNVFATTVNAMVGGAAKIFGPESDILRI